MVGLQVTVERRAPRAAGAVGVIVPARGAVPREIPLSRAQLAAMGFEGKSGQVASIPGRGGAVVVAVGVGDPRALDAAALRTVAAQMARAAASHAHLATDLATHGRGDRAAIAQAVVEGLRLATHRYDALKGDKGATPALAHVSLVAPAAAQAALRRGVARGTTIADAVCLARDLANMPPAYLTARMLADRAVALAGATGLRAEVFNKDQLLAMGCGGMIGVNQGSVEPPRMVRLTYAAGGRGKRPHLVLVGKGVMYDSGGISLKPSDPSHAMMKADMSGAAAVLATMASLRALGCRADVTGYLMCTDNLPSGSALKMGDVITIRNGKTVEIHNTDAEGRLILADGLSLAAEQEPDAIVDIATLTGACARALGPHMAGVMGNQQGIVDQLLAAAGRTQEKLWQLPLEREYRKMIDSYIADMKNVGGADAGAITAALFLDEFTDGRPWAHLDIAGPMWADADGGWLQRGATGYGTRLLIDLAEHFTAP
jgi:leucyl aminopeptidase